MKSAAEWAKILKDNGLTSPGTIRDMRWKAALNDWYAKTDDGWFWWNPRKKIWMLMGFEP